MRYHNITKDDMSNGDGLRVVLWVAGCNHHCIGCHNPVTWNPNDGLVFNDEAKAEIMEQLNHPYIAGLTLSGGDPLHEANVNDLLSLVREVKEKFPNKTIWIYTGYTWEEILEMGGNYKKLIGLCDVLCDGRYEAVFRSPQEHWVGSDNQRVINIKASLDSDYIVLHENKQ